VFGFKYPGFLCYCVEIRVPSAERDTRLLGLATNVKEMLDFQSREAS
jgi:hypothetical protein